MIVLYVLQLVAEVVALISWFTILFTGKLPEGLAGYQAMYIRYLARTYTYLGFLREEYPPFTFDDDAADPGDDPRVRVDFAPDAHRSQPAHRVLPVHPRRSRRPSCWPFVGLALAFVCLIAFFAVLFTGRWPEGMRNFVLGVTQWYIRFLAYVLLLTDKYRRSGSTDEKLSRGAPTT